MYPDTQVPVHFPWRLVCQADPDQAQVQKNARAPQHHQGQQMTHLELGEIRLDQRAGKHVVQIGDPARQMRKEVLRCHRHSATPFRLTAPVSELWHSCTAFAQSGRALPQLYQS